MTSPVRECLYVEIRVPSFEHRVVSCKLPASVVPQIPDNAGLPHLIRPKKYCPTRSLLPRGQPISMGFWASMTIIDL